MSKLTRFDANALCNWHLVYAHTIKSPSIRPKWHFQRAKLTMTPRESIKFASPFFTRQTKKSASNKASCSFSIRARPQRICLGAKNGNSSRPSARAPTRILFATLQTAQSANNKLPPRVPFYITKQLYVGAAWMCAVKIIGSFFVAKIC